MKAPYRESEDPVVVCAGHHPTCAPCCRAEGGAVHCPVHCKTPGDKITWRRCVGIEMPKPAFRPQWGAFFARLAFCVVAVGMGSAGLLRLAADNEVELGLADGPSAADVAAAVSSCAVSAIAGQPITEAPKWPDGGLSGDLSGASAGLRWTGNRWEWTRPAAVDGGMP